MTELDKSLLRHALTIARYSYEAGNLPFGCLLTDENGNVLEIGENTVISDNDNIAHCEINLVHQIAGRYDVNFLNNCSIYASTEPCPMCAAAIFWAGIGRIVFAISKHEYHHIAQTKNPAYIFDLSSSELLVHAKRKVAVEGPGLNEEASIFYKSISH